MRHARPILATILATASLCGLPGRKTEAVEPPSYPTQSIKLIVPAPAGGIADLLARILAQKVAQNTGKTLVVENQPAGGGVVATQTVARAEPDGHTVFLGFQSTLTVLPHLMGKMPYDPRTDFTPVIFLATAPNVLLVHPSLPIASVRELVAYAKANPGQLSFASQGPGSTGHILGEQFKRAAKIDIVHVPYRGSPQAHADLIAGNVGMLFGDFPLIIEQLRSGSVRALAVTASRRSEAFPDVPTTAEEGLPQLLGAPWFGLLVPAKTPRRVVEWLHGAAERAFSANDVRTRLAALALSTPLGSPEDFSSFIEADRARWGELIAQLGLKIQ